MQRWFGSKRAEGRREGGREKCGLEGLMFEEQNQLTKRSGRVKWCGQEATASLLIFWCQTAGQAMCGPATSLLALYRVAQRFVGDGWFNDGHDGSQMEKAGRFYFLCCAQVPQEL